MASQCDTTGEMEISDKRHRCGGVGWCRIYYSRRVCATALTPSLDGSPNGATRNVPAMPDRNGIDIESSGAVTASRSVDGKRWFVDGSAVGSREIEVRNTGIVGVEADENT